MRPEVVGLRFESQSRDLLFGTLIFLLNIQTKVMNFATIGNLLVHALRHAANLRFFQDFSENQAEYILIRI